MSFSNDLHATFEEKTPICWQSPASNPAQCCTGSASLRHHCWDSPALSRHGPVPAALPVTSSSTRGQPGQTRLRGFPRPESSCTRSLAAGRGKRGERHTVNSPELFRSMFSDLCAKDLGQSPNLPGFLPNGDHTAPARCSALSKAVKVQTNVSTSPHLRWDTWKALTTPGHAAGPYAQHAFVGTFYSEAFSYHKQKLLCKATTIRR